VLRPILVGGDVGQVDVGLLAGAELDLGLLGGLLQTLQGQRIVVQVDALILFELAGQPVDDAQVKVLAAEKGIAVGGQNLELVLPLDLGEGPAEDEEDRRGLSR